MKRSTFLLCALSVSTLLFESSAFLAPIQRNSLKGKLKNACQLKDEAKIISVVNELSKLNPTKDITKDFAKLDGQWKLAFTTAPSSEVPDEEASGFSTYQKIETKKGIIYNVIDRGLPAKGLRIGVGAEPTRPGRVALDFRTIEVFGNFPRGKLRLAFPDRALVKAVAKLVAKVRGEAWDELRFKEIAHFDVLFLDEDLRVQRNSEGNLFVNTRIPADARLPL